VLRNAAWVGRDEEGTHPDADSLVRTTRKMAGVSSTLTKFTAPQWHTIRQPQRAALPLIPQMIAPGRHCPNDNSISCRQGDHSRADTNHHRGVFRRR